MESLEQARKAAEDHYKTREYLNLVEEMNGYIAAIRRRIIAVDLEGTLVSGNLAAAGCLADFAYLRRPLANEFLAGLAAAENTLLLWTAATRRNADQIISLTGLRLPEGMRVVAQDDTRRAMQDNGVIGEKFKNMFPAQAQEAACGFVKIPGLFGVDLLLDDQTHYHRAFCRLLNREHETRRIFFVYPFGQSSDDITEHHRDGELNQVAKILAPPI